MFARSELDRGRLQTLLQEGYIESLVKEGRTPLLMDAFTGDHKAVVCLIPPKEASPEDRVELNGGYFCVYDPSGRFKGTTSFNVLTLGEADVVKQRIERALNPSDPTHR